MPSKNKRQPNKSASNNKNKKKNKEGNPNRPFRVSGTDVVYSKIAGAVGTMQLEIAPRRLVGTRLEHTSRGYDGFKMRANGLTIRWVSYTPQTVAGGVHIGFDYDPMDTMKSDPIAEIATMQKQIVCAGYRDRSVKITFPSQANMLNCVLDPHNMRSCSAGQIKLYIDSAVSGDIYIDWDVDFYHPQLTPSSSLESVTSVTSAVSTTTQAWEYDSDVAYDDATTYNTLKTNSALDRDSTYTCIMRSNANVYDSHDQLVPEGTRLFFTMADMVLDNLTGGTLSQAATAATLIGSLWNVAGDFLHTHSGGSFIPEGLFKLL